MITVNGLSFNSFQFSGGEWHIRLDDSFPILSGITIRAHLTNSDEILKLFLLTDALRRKYPSVAIRLVCPYLPYARQDRVCNPGEAFSLKLMCSLLNNMKYEKIELWDVHSDVSTALLDNVTITPCTTFIGNISPLADKVLVSPDAGATKKVLNVAKHYSLPMYEAGKVRDTKTGEIVSSVYYGPHIGNKDFLIVDDICDGGKTFIELAKILKQNTSGKVELYVTHGIFSKGLGIFNNLIDHIYVASPFPGVDLNNPILTVVGNKL